MCIKTIKTMGGRKLKENGTPYLALIRKVKETEDKVEVFMGRWNNTKEVIIEEKECNHWVDAEIWLKENGCNTAIFWGKLREERSSAKRVIKKIIKTKHTLFPLDLFEEMKKDMEYPDDTTEEDIFENPLYDEEAMWY